MDPRQHVSPGDPIRLAAEQVNGLNRVLNTPVGFGGPTRIAEELPYTWIWCSNFTGGNIPQWSIVEVGVPGNGFINIPQGSDREKSFFRTPILGARTPTYNPYTTGQSPSQPPRLPAFGVTVECAKPDYPMKVAIAGCVQARVARPAGLPSTVFGFNYQNGLKAHPEPGNTNNLVMDHDGNADIVWIDENAKYNNNVNVALIRIGASQSPQILQGVIDSPTEDPNGDFFWRKDYSQQVDVYNPTSSILVPPRATVWNRMAAIGVVPRGVFKTPPGAKMKPTVGVTFAAVQNEWRLVSIAYTYTDY